MVKDDEYKNSTNLEPLFFDVLLQHCHSSFDDLPVGLREYATIVAGQVSWDALSDEMRKKKTKEALENDQTLFDRAFEDAIEVQKIEQEISEMEATVATIPSEKIIKMNHISDCRKAIEKIHSRNKENPAVLVSNLKSKGFSEFDIAVELDRLGCSSHVIGSLLPAYPGTKIAHDSISKRGRNLLRKGKMRNNPK